MLNRRTAQMLAFNEAVRTIAIDNIVGGEICLVWLKYTKPSDIFSSVVVLLKRVKNSQEYMEGKKNGTVASEAYTDIYDIASQ